MRNIEIFKEISGLALAQAYDSFPLKISIRPSDLSLALSDDLWDESQRLIAENHHEYVRNRSPIGLAAPTVQWLVESGFLSCERYHDGEFSGVSLTAKGLESIESQEGAGEKLVKAAAGLVKEELKEQARAQLSNVFTALMSWGIKNAPTIYASISRAGGP